MLPALTKPALLPQTTSAPNMEVTSSEHHKSAQEREAKIFPGINYFSKRIVYCPTQLVLYLSTDQYQGHDLLVVYMGYIKGVQNRVCSRICLAQFLGHHVGHTASSSMHVSTSFDPIVWRTWRYQFIITFVHNMFILCIQSCIHPPLTCACRLLSSPLDWISC